MTERPPAALANLTASTSEAPSASRAARAPLKTSPAAVVSTAFTLKPGINRLPSRVATSAPLAPSVTITVPTPRLRRIWAARAADETPVTLMPVRCVASDSLGVSRVTLRRSESGRRWAGAGFRMTSTPARRAIRAAASTVLRGVSSWTRRTRALAMRPFAAATSTGESRWFAPPATPMLFAPSEPTKIRATPEGCAPSRVTQETSNPSSLKRARASSPRESLPRRATKATCPPARAAATAWLAPFPPAAVRNSPPRRVSPGLGTWATRRIISSVLELPTTTTEFFLARAMSRPRAQDFDSTSRESPTI